MSKRKAAYPKDPKTELKAIKYYSDYQLHWDMLIPRLREYSIQTVDFLSMTGDAPKDFITDSEYRPGHRTQQQRSESYIAKVGSKFYPNESITEQLITEIGKSYGLKIADSKLRVVDRQVRFMSKYFLNRRVEQLTHGAEIYEYSLGKENYAQLSKNKTESDFFTFEMTIETLRQLFPENAEKIIKGFVEMLTFDCLIGHNDRHPYNWGVIVPIQKSRAPKFSPVYDTARALFWNIPESLTKFFWLSPQNKVITARIKFRGVVVKNNFGVGRQRFFRQRISVLKSDSNPFGLRSWRRSLAIIKNPMAGCADQKRRRCNKKAELAFQQYFPPQEL